jgi:hypothetical protein
MESGEFLVSLGRAHGLLFSEEEKKKKKHKKKPKKKQTTAMHARSLILFYVHGSERRCSGGWRPPFLTLSGAKNGWGPSHGGRADP